MATVKKISFFASFFNYLFGGRGSFLSINIFAMFKIIIWTDYWSTVASNAIVDMDNSKFSPMKTINIIKYFIVAASIDNRLASDVWGPY